MPSSRCATVNSDAATHHTHRRRAPPSLNSHTTRSTYSPDPQQPNCAPAMPPVACSTSSKPTTDANGAQKPAATAPEQHATTKESATNNAERPNCLVSKVVRQGG